MPLEQYTSKFNFAKANTEDEEYLTNNSNISNIEIPSIRAWHPSTRMPVSAPATSIERSPSIPTSPVTESQQDNLSAIMAKPSLSTWFQNLGKDKQSALGQAALVAGVSMMSTPPSRYPISFGQQLGQAGMAGMQQYTNAMQNAREIEMQNKLFGLKERELAAAEPYYTARTKALAEKPDLTKEAEKPDLTKEKAYKLIIDIDNILATAKSLAMEPEQIDSIMQIRESLLPYILMSQKIEQQKTDLLAKQEATIEAERQRQEEAAAEAAKPGLFKKAITGIWGGLGKGDTTTKIPTNIEKRAIPSASFNLKESLQKYGFMKDGKGGMTTKEMGVQKEFPEIVLPKEITHTTQAREYLMQNYNMTKDEADNWLKGQ